MIAHAYTLGTLSLTHSTETDRNPACEIRRPGYAKIRPRRLCTVKPISARLISINSSKYFVSEGEKKGQNSLSRPTCSANKKECCYFVETRESRDMKG